MVFREAQPQLVDKVAHLGKYHPYRIWDSGGEKVKNPNFDAYSGFMLDIKENKTGVVERFRDYLEKLLAPDIAIAVVPSHDPAKTTSGIRTLAAKIAANDRIDATTCLVRTKLIEKLATGGNRSAQVHLDSIEVRNDHLFNGRHVLLLDDIMTTGNSLAACRQLLQGAGAASVQQMALAKTVHE